MRSRLSFALVLSLGVLVLVPPAGSAAERGVIGAWTFNGRVPQTQAPNQTLVVQGRFTLHPGCTLVFTDDGALQKGLPKATLASLLARGVRMSQGPALGSWSLDDDVFTFRARRFVYDNADPLGLAIGTQTIAGQGSVTPGPLHTVEWTFDNGWLVKWEGPDFDAAKNEVAVETVESAHEELAFATEPADPRGPGGRCPGRPR